VTSRTRKRDGNLERYEEIRRMCVEIVARHTDVDSSTIERLFANETGYQTPKLDVRAAVVRDGQILLVKQKGEERGWTASSVTEDWTTTVLD
jgi:hypothetical protein